MTNDTNNREEQEVVIVHSLETFRSIPWFAPSTHVWVVDGNKGAHHGAKIIGEPFLIPHYNFLRNIPKRKLMGKMARGVEDKSILYDHLQYNISDSSCALWVILVLWVECRRKDLVECCRLAGPIVVEEEEDNTNNINSLKRRSRRETSTAAQSETTTTESKPDQNTTNTTSRRGQKGDSRIRKRSDESTNQKKDKGDKKRLRIEEETSSDEDSCTNDSSSDDNDYVEVAVVGDNNNDGGTDDSRSKGKVRHNRNITVKKDTKSLIWEGKHPNQTAQSQLLPPEDGKVDKCTRSSSDVYKETQRQTKNVVTSSWSHYHKHLAMEKLEQYHNFWNKKQEQLLSTNMSSNHHHHANTKILERPEFGDCEFSSDDDF